MTHVRVFFDARRRPRLLAVAAAVVGSAVCSGCAGPAPTPPPPRVVGLDRYVEGAKAYDAGDRDKALVLLEQAVKENPNLTMARVLLGDLYRKKNDYRHASDQYEAAARLDPYSFKNHYDLAIAYQFLDRLEESAAAYLKALALAPRDLNSNMNLGLVYLALGRTDDAVRQLQKTTAIAPRSADAQCNLGVALDAAGQPAKAELAYRRAMELDPKHATAMVDLGTNLVRQNRGKEAAAVLTAAVKKVNTPAVHKRLGDAWFLQRQDDTALNEYDAALKLDGQYWPALNQVGLVLVRKYQAGMTLNEDLRVQAVAVWEKSLALRPDQPQIRQWVAQWDQGGKLVP